jgi:hypothetical protein
MNTNARRSRLAAAAAAVVAAYLVQGLIRRPAWRANVAWALHSWWRPADREAYWQQAAGDVIDPWDTFLRRGGTSRGARGRQPSAAPSAGGSR